VDPALRSLWSGPDGIRADAGSDESGTYNDPAGGFLVPGSQAPFVLSTPSEQDPSAGRTLQVPTVTPTVDVAARVDKNHTTSTSGGLVVYRNPETVTITPSRQAYERITLHAYEAVGLTFATNKIVTDSLPEFAALLDVAYRDEFAALFLDERLWGTGLGRVSGRDEVAVPNHGAEGERPERGHRDRPEPRENVRALLALRPGGLAGDSRRHAAGDVVGHGDRRAVLAAQAPTRTGRPT